MARGNGSLIGIDATPTASVASGIWTVREAEQYLRAGKWPSQPTVPGAPTGSPGDGQVSLSWTAVTVSPPVTDYIVQYSDDAGATWSTFSDGVGTSTSAVVTGLTNGTGYVFRISAVNALGQGPVGSASATITPAPQTAAYLLMHFDGNLNDSSANAFGATASGNAAVSTTQSKFGGSSLYLDGSGDYLELAGTNTGALEDVDYTVEAWFRADDSSASGTIASNWAGAFGGDFILAITGGHLAAYAQQASASAGDAAYVSGGTIVTGQWHHAALTRSGTTARLFLDGVMVASASVPYKYNPASKNPITVGAYGGGSLWNFAGYIDELRIVVGTAVYDSDLGFTPPAAPFA